MAQFITAIKVYAHHVNHSLYFNLTYNTVVLYIVDHDMSQFNW